MGVFHERIEYPTVRHTIPTAAGQNHAGTENRVETDSTESAAEGAEENKK